MAEVIYTVGHSVRSLPDFLALLREAGVTVLVDVRRYPASRRHPHFAREPLAAALASAGIGYEHEPDLGGRRSPRRGSPNTSWRNAGFRGYADHMATTAFQAALDRLLARAGTARLAVMCAEAVPWRCHRQLLADALVACGRRVLHLVKRGGTVAHELHPSARVLEDGRLVYPAAGRQPSLFPSTRPAGRRHGRDGGHRP